VVATLEGPPRAGQLPSLTGLRGIAASAVFINHVGYWLFGTPLAERWSSVTYIAICGVIMFFALSGFLLAQPQAMRGGRRAFWARRAARILPVYLLSLGAMWAFGMYHDASEPRLRPANLIANILLVQSWGSSGTDASINLPAWSLSVELLFYATLPLMIRPCTRAVTRWPIASLALLLVLTQAGAVAVRWGGAKTFPPCYLPVFLLGVYAALRPTPRVSPRLLLALTIVCIATSLPLRYFGLAAPVFALLVSSLARRDGIKVEGTLASPVAGRFGVWSYGFFLLHVPVGFVMVSVIASPQVTGLGLAWAVVQFVLSWMLAAVVYRTFEEPARQRLSKAIAA
jgi:peptidoglycan/LPS O-acetylase OafA/YrhL